MSTILFSIGFFLLMALMMAIGVIFGRKPIKGSCGGMSAMTGGSGCSVCGGDTTKCDSSSEQPGDSRPTAAFHDASGVRH